MEELYIPVHLSIWNRQLWHCEIEQAQEIYSILINCNYNTTEDKLAWKCNKQNYTTADT